MHGTVERQVNTVAKGGSTKNYNTRLALLVKRVPLRCFGCLASVLTPKSCKMSVILHKHSDLVRNKKQIVRPPHKDDFGEKTVWKEIQSPLKRNAVSVEYK